ncbi:hypothetical protein OG21DRAFT_1483859 [Imleria badia]|nr:hypothetical protein OG21DRAFT_1483859 [Imleria badia]
MTDYALNFTFPWSLGQEFDYYNIPDALSPEAPTDGSVFLNNAQTRAAIHAPTSKDWVEVIPFPFAPTSEPTNVYMIWRGRAAGGGDNSPVLGNPNPRTNPDPNRPNPRLSVAHVQHHVIRMSASRSSCA